MFGRLPQPDPTAPVGIISAHLDDAVLSCAGAVTPGSVVVTVFAAGPSRVDPMSPWDLASGCFKPGDDVFAVRTEEDDAALAALEATGRRLRFWDGQYRNDGPWRRPYLSRLARLIARESSNEDELSASVMEELDAIVSSSGFDTWLFPLGISHPDHRMLGAILPTLARERPEINWHVYEDLPYALEQPAERDGAHRRLESEGFKLEPVPVDIPVENKRRAANCYRSQLRPLGDRVEAAVTAPERVYKLVNGSL